VGSVRRLEGSDAHGPRLTFQRSENAAGGQLHLDLYADDPDGEAARLIRLGAQSVRRVEEGDTWWWSCEIRTEMCSA
jgi:Glyoxalase-like domain